MKKHKKPKNSGLSLSDIQVGYLYLTQSGQFRAVLAVEGDFMIYAPSSEGLSATDLQGDDMPFDNSPFKKCQIVTFAKKDYQEFSFDGTLSLYHRLTEKQMAQAIQQCNAKLAIQDLLA